MSTQPQAVEKPPVEIVVSEVVANLAFAAHAYLQPKLGEDAADLESAKVALDVAGAAFDRIQTRLPAQEHAVLSGLLTNLRMEYVRKRGT